MKIFHCDHCDNLVYFENTNCVNCGNVLAYLPDRQEICSLEIGEDKNWRVPKSDQYEAYRLCQNYVEHNVCNWAVRSDEDTPYCVSCRLTENIPDLTVPGNKEAWARLETAKRRLVYSCLALGLPVTSKKDQPEGGMIFDFLADNPGQPVLTGHDEGLIVLNIAEADDAEREKRRLQMHEPYRTLLGHFRHEVGHYYWDVLIKGSDRLQACRDVFGDESFSYEEALKIHYEQGAPANWQESYISAYATTHPWEDWAETWAHYMHMSDTLETAAACGLSLLPSRPDEPHLAPQSGNPASTFDEMIQNWYPLTHMLNSLNRGLGLPDGYPFVISTPIVEKLRFIHETIALAAGKEPSRRMEAAAA